MIDVNMEYRKGILFIRFIGSLNKFVLNRLKDVDDILNKGISCVVFNLEELERIDEEGINYLWEIYQIVKGNGGVAFVCGIKKKTLKKTLNHSYLLKYMNEIQDELILLQQN